MRTHVPSDCITLSLFNFTRTSPPFVGYRPMISDIILRYLSHTLKLNSRISLH